MTKEQLEKELKVFDREKNTILYHVKKFLTDETESNGFIHSYVELTNHGRYNVQLCLADCSRTIYLDIDPFESYRSIPESFDETYNTAINKLDLISSVCQDLKKIFEDNYESQRKRMELQHRLDELNTRDED